MTNSNKVKEGLTLEEWRNYSADKKRKIIEEWDFSGPDAAFLKNLVQEFKEVFGNLKGLTIHGMGNYHGCLVLGVSHRFIFDRRQLPDDYLGMPVHCSVTDVPTDFQINKKYIWAPENYQHFVERHADKIKEELGCEDMSTEEMLCALCGMPFSNWIDVCRGFGKGYTAL